MEKRIGICSVCAYHCTIQLCTIHNNCAHTTDGPAKPYHPSCTFAKRLQTLALLHLHLNSFVLASTYGEISSNVRKMVSIAVEYGYKHLGASILASDLDAVKNSIRRRFHTTIAMASWRGYANMLLGRIQYVGKAYAFNKVQRQYRLVEHLDQGAFGSWSCAHLMDRPLPDLHPSGWAY